MSLRDRLWQPSRKHQGGRLRVGFCDVNWNVVKYSPWLDNIIPFGGRYFTLDRLIDRPETAGGLKYIALGYGTLLPSTSDVKLQDEYVRKGIPEAGKNRSAEEVSLTAFFPAYDCAYLINRVGVFGGAAATETKDSGTLFAHLKPTIDNSSGEWNLSMEYVFDL